jgi:hypothetical protein
MWLGERRSAFGAPLRGFGLDRSARPSKQAGRAVDANF